MKSFTARDIIALLRRKHQDDVFIPETQYNGRYLDAWAMKRNYKTSTSFGYEIKVSRSDFLNDHKWMGYLDCCNRFSFVCPRGLIEPKELPDEVGLYWLASTGTRLFTKKNAPFRKVSVDQRFLLQIIFNKFVPDKEDRVEYWKQWLVNAREKQEVGYAVRHQIGDLIRNTQRENRQLRNENEALQEIKAFLTEKNIPIGGFNPLEKLKELVEQPLAPIVKKLEYQEESLNLLIKNLKKHGEDTQITPNPRTAP